jgi:FKBP-type peptidyl-prolyl cis-trans isomerase
LAFAAGSGTLISIIDNSVLDMNVGEIRTLIAPHYKVYGNTDRGLSSNSILIFKLELLSINDIN